MTSTQEVAGLIVVSSSTELSRKSPSMHVCRPTQCVGPCILRAKLSPVSLELKKKVSKESKRNGYRPQQCQRRENWGCEQGPEALEFS